MIEDMIEWIECRARALEKTFREVLLFLVIIPLLVFLWTRGDNDRLSPHFRMDEFTCNCGSKECVEQYISASLLFRLEKVRRQYGKPIVITSGYRCDAYQAHLLATLPEGQTVKQSTHQKWEYAPGRWAPCAADIANRDIVLEGLLSDEFMAFGNGSRFEHVDERDDRHRYWRY